MINWMKRRIERSRARVHHVSPPPNKQRARLFAQAKGESEEEQQSKADPRARRRNQTFK